MTITCPVTLSFRQNATTCSAMSAASAARPSTMLCRARSTTSGGIRLAIRVPSTRPGATQFTVIFGGERHRETACEMDEGRLARCVAERAAHGNQARHGGDVDDAPTTLPLHVRGGSARELKWSAHVGGEQAVPHVRGELVEVGEWHADVPGSIVDENVETPEGLGGRADRRVDGQRFRLIEWEGAGAAPKPFDGLDRLGGAIAVADVRESDIAAGASEGNARRCAEITRSPRHQGYPPEEIHVRSTSCDVPRPPAGGLSGSRGRAVKTVIRARFGTPRRSRRRARDWSPSAGGCTSRARSRSGNPRREGRCRDAGGARRASRHPAPGHWSSSGTRGPAR